MQPNQPIYTREATCQDCYRCLRECPVKAITVRNGMAAIDSVRCIYCGTCLGVCPVEAKAVRDDVSMVKTLQAKKKKIIVSLAPSWVVAFPYSIEKLSAGIQKIGFHGISETALGAHLISREIAHWLQVNAAAATLPPLVISTACPAIVALIRKHYPKLVPYLSPFCSPLIAHSRFLKKQFGDESGVVFIGPCPAKKTEVSESAGALDAVLSFKDLKFWFEKENINLDSLALLTNAIPADLPAAHGALYPIEGGMIESIRACGSLPTMEMQTISGIESATAVLADIDPGSLASPVFLELLACKSGCINGACMPKSGHLLHKRIAVRAHADALVNFATNPEQSDVSGLFASDPLPQTEFSAEQIRGALERIGKRTDEDELNCGGCGYSICREFAQALLENRAEPAMCVSYMRSMAMKKANALMQSMPAGAVIVGKDLHIIECNLRFVQIAAPDLVPHYQATESLANADIEKLAPLDKYFKAVLTTNTAIYDKQIKLADRIVSISVFPIEPNQLVGGIIQDITQPAVRKEQTISKAREVSRRQLTMVQQIASLLGENAAESETLLSEIIESFSSSDDEGRSKL